MEECRRVVFTDDKRFCLDDPDGHAKFWADRRLLPDIFAERARGGGGIMFGLEFPGKRRPSWRLWRER